MVVRTALLGASRVAGRVVDPGAAANWHLRGAKAPAEAASRAMLEIEALLPPEPVEVVTNYVRGMVLLERAGRGDVRIQYRRDPERGVIDEQSKRIPKRIRTIERRLDFEVRFDHDFAAVLEASRRKVTWITDEIKAVYLRLHELGFASSIAVYQGGELVGGLWGIEVGTSFGLMSVFHRVDHAGSMALIAMVNQVGAGLRWQLVDTGEVKPSFERFGAHAVPTDEFTGRVLAGLVPAGVRASDTSAPVAVVTAPNGSVPAASGAAVRDGR